jgi:hypothetical protein
MDTVTECRRRTISEFKFEKKMKKNGSCKFCQDPIYFPSPFSSYIIKMQVGQACEKCKRHDFLPFNCKNCSKVYCQDHRFDHLPCSSISSSPISLDKTPLDHTKQCHFCQEMDLSASSCKDCSSVFCLKHRSPLDHACKNISMNSGKMPEVKKKASAITRFQLN